MKNSYLPRLKTRTILLIFFNLAILLLLFFAKCEKRKILGENTGSIRLLLPTTLKDAKEIVLTERDGIQVSSLRIIKEEPAWRLKAKHCSYYIKKDLIESFLFSLTREVDAYFITNNFRLYSSYKLDEDSAFNLRIIGSDGNILQDIYFGSKDVTGQRIYARRGNVASSVISIFDFASPFLCATPSFWVEMQVYKEKLKKNHITYVENGGEEKIFRTLKNEDAFLKLEHTLSSLTMINIFDGARRETERTTRLTFGMEEGEAFSLSITELESGDSVFVDEGSKATYILSAYSKNRFLEALEALEPL